MKHCFAMFSCAKSVPQLPGVFSQFLLLCYYSRNSNFCYLGWRNGLGLVKPTFSLCTSTLLLTNEINVHYKIDTIMTVPMSQDMSPLGKYTMSSADMVSSQFWENPPIHHGRHGHYGTMHQPLSMCKRKQASSCKKY